MQRQNQWHAKIDNWEGAYSYIRVYIPCLTTIDFKEFNNAEHEYINILSKTCCRMLHPPRK